ncbi:DNA-3-methyladenine glycosylase I [Bacteroidia bacterium]|nr:DNA-3-methyladenine glycosylase I [Bacteroidia bacterium]
MNQEDTRRCGWCKSDPIYIKYHDEEWGREVRDDHKMFEFLVLESAQAGLSWITILKRRDAYRNAFAGYDAEKVAQMTEQDVERLMQDSGIIRNRNKIQATISNAQRFLEVQKEFGSFCNYLRTFLPKGKPVINYWKTLSEIPASTPLSDAISKDMKKRGFKFFGTTICYAHLQAVGYVNDHLEDCSFKYETA